MTIQLNSRRELFTDHYLLDRLAGVHHHLHRPVPAGNVFSFDKPWEGNSCGYTTLLHDGEKYRFYYRGWNAKPGQTDQDNIPCYCVAYSNDGVTFTRPNLGLVEFQGSKNNNIILHGSDYHAFAPFVDTRPGTPPDQRFKALSTDSNPGAHELHAMASADGLSWRNLQDTPVLDRHQGAFDSLNLAFWSEHENCYVCYGRTWSNPKEGSMYGGKRTISRFTSPDFLHWSSPASMTFSGTPLEEFYTSSTTPYPRAPHIYLAFPKRFVRHASPLTPAQSDEFNILPSQRGDVSDGCFLSSRGGNHYDRLFMEAFIPPGRDQRNWGARSHTSAWGMAQTVNALGQEEISLYYNCHYGQPTLHVTRYTLRTDGFVSLRAPWQSGSFTTKPFTFTGGRLSLNLATSAAGSLKIELQNPQGQPIAGYTLADSKTLTGDTLDTTATWTDGQDVSSLAGKQVRLHIEMRDADLYSLKFE